MPTKGARMAAGYDIYPLNNRTIPAQRQMLVETGISIRLPKGTYGSLAARSGMASKQGTAVGGGVMDADYTGGIRVILRNHGTSDYQFKAGDQIAQLIVETIQTSEAVVVDKLGVTERGKQGFGLTHVGPKRLITSKEHKIMMCFLHPDPRNNTFYDEEDILMHGEITREVTMLSNAIIAAVQMQTMDESFWSCVRMAGKNDDTWTKRKGELSRLKEQNEQLPKNGELEDVLIDYKNILLIPSNEDLLTEIAKGCHNSRVAGHFEQEKTIEFVTRNFYWDKLADWINDYVRSRDECQHNKSLCHTKYGLLQPLGVPYSA